MELKTYFNREDYKNYKLNQGCSEDDVGYTDPHTFKDDSDKFIIFVCCKDNKIR